MRPPLPAAEPLVKIAFCSGTDDLNRELVERIAALYPELPLYVVSEFPPAQGKWVPYHVNRTLWENLARCRAALGGARVRLAAVLLVPQVPYRRMRIWRCCFPQWVSSPITRRWAPLCCVPATCRPSFATSPGAHATGYAGIGNGATNPGGGRRACSFGPPGSPRAMPPRTHDGTRTRARRAASPW